MSSTKMSPRLQTQIAKSKEEALAAFISKKAEIDAMLTRLQALSDDHFNYSPDEIDWGHVGTLGYYAGSRTQPSRRASTPNKRPGLPPSPRAAPAAGAWVRRRAVVLSEDGDDP
jgi:hypothetical protein